MTGVLLLECFSIRHTFPFHQDGISLRLRTFKQEHKHVGILLARGKIGLRIKEFTVCSQEMVMLWE